MLDVVQKSSVLPSIHVNICVTIRLSISLPAFSRLGVMESISSINSMLGAATTASLNRDLIVCSVSPLIPDTTSVDATLRNGSFSSCVKKLLYRGVCRGVSRWSFSQKQLTAESHDVFLQEAPPYMFYSDLNTKPLRLFTFSVQRIYNL